MSSRHKYVPMPWDERNPVYPKSRPSMTKWEFIKDKLRRPIENVEQLIDVIKSYNDSLPSMPPLSLEVLRSVLNENQKGFFGKGGVISTIQELALSLETKCQTVPWLHPGKDGLVKLSQKEIARILANSFFCTFTRTDKRQPSINLIGIFEGGRRFEQSREKLKCLMNYFYRIHQESPGSNYVYFYRRSMSKKDYPLWEKSTKLLTYLYTDAEGLIEDQDDHLQMDFANKVIGGGVLGSGCVQEEIRFLICPELIVARLFCPPMDENEAIIIIGAERFTNYSGYASGFQFSGNFVDKTELGHKHRRKTHIVAVDAMYFDEPNKQYLDSCLRRELGKLYAGLKPIKEEQGAEWPVATGNWGCGAFRGDPQFKSLIQIIAASEVSRKVAYFTFGDKQFKSDLDYVYGQLVENAINVGQLYDILKSYQYDKNRKQTVFDFVLQSINERRSVNNSSKNSHNSSPGRDFGEHKPHTPERSAGEGYGIVHPKAEKTTGEGYTGNKANKAETPTKGGHRSNPEESKGGGHSGVEYQGQSSNFSSHEYSTGGGYSGNNTNKGGHGGTYQRNAEELAGGGHNGVYPNMAGYIGGQSSDFDRADYSVGGGYAANNTNAAGKPANWCGTNPGNAGQQIGGGNIANFPSNSVGGWSVSGGYPTTGATPVGGGQYSGSFPNTAEMSMGGGHCGSSYPSAAQLPTGAQTRVGGAYPNPAMQSMGGEHSYPPERSMGGGHGGTQPRTAERPGGVSHSGNKSMPQVHVVEGTLIPVPSIGSSQSSATHRPVVKQGSRYGNIHPFLPKEPEEELPPPGAVLQATKLLYKNKDKSTSGKSKMHKDGTFEYTV